MITCFHKTCLGAAIVFAGLSGLSDSTAQAKTVGAEITLANTPLTPRPDGFRLIGDRAGTVWVSPDGTSDLFFTKVPTRPVQLNRAAIIETFQKPAPIGLITDTNKDLEPASFVSRKVATQDVRHNTLISWPILFVSAFLGLCLWASDRRKKAAAS